MALDVEGINSQLTGFGEWLDGTFEGERNYLTHPSQRCGDFSCPSRVRLAPVPLMTESQALLGPVGQEFKGSKLDVHLTQHVAACAGLLIAKIVHASETGTKLASNAVWLIQKKRTLSLAGNWGDFISATDMGENSTTVLLGGDKYQRGLPYRTERHLTTAAGVGAFVEIMKGEISQYLQT